MNIIIVPQRGTYTPQRGYKTISKIHLEWARNKVYENAYTEYIRINKCCDITHDNFIDGTLRKLKIFLN